MEIHYTKITKKAQRGTEIFLCDPLCLLRDLCALDFHTLTHPPALRISKIYIRKNKHTLSPQEINLFTAITKQFFQADNNFSCTQVVR
jgi:hypothetical protein